MKDIEILIKTLRSALVRKEVEIESSRKAHKLLDNLIACEQNIARDRVTGEFNRDGEFIRLCR